MAVYIPWHYRAGRVLFMAEVRHSACDFSSLWNIFQIYFIPNGIHSEGNRHDAKTISKKMAAIPFV